MKKFLGLAAVIAALGLIVSMFGCSNAADGQGFNPIAPLPPATYTITFNAHDGSETPATATQSFAFGTPQALKAIAELGFTKPGFKFAGWLAAADATELSYADGASYTATADATLYALWTLIPTELNTPLTLEAIEDGKFVFTNPWSTFKYKKNGGEFETVTTTNLGTNRDVAYIDVVAGDKVALYADGSENDSVAGKYFTIVSRKSCYVYGNVMSLESSTDFENLTVVKESSAFANLFTDYHTPEFIGHQKNKIRSHAKITLQLPATMLAESCYDSMFYECEELERAPALPATTLKKSCYRNMFGECSALTSVPDVLPATTLVDSCYIKMFYGCVKLEKTPELPAQNLASKCYMQMFNGCEILENAPALPATTLVSQCYTGMFMACYKLQNAPELPAKELKEGCYNSMFMACTSLNYIKCLAESGITTSNTSNWTKNTASDGNFIKANGANWPTGANGIPTNWTVQTPIPEYNIAVTGGKAKNASGAVITKATAGTVVKLEPNDAPMGQAFSYWQSSSAGVSFATSSKDSNTTFTMPANDVSISANFYALKYNINTSGISNGTVTAKNSSGNVITSAAYGETVTLQIAAADHYEYTADSISVTGVTSLGGSGLTRTFTMPAQNVTVSASFTALRKITLTLAYNSANCGSVTSTKTEYAPNAAVTIAFSVSEGAELESVMGSGISATVNGSAATFTMPDKDVELSYRFKAKTKAALSKIGDVALKDGSFIDIDNVDKMNRNQKNNAYAVIFDVANKKGVEKNLGSGVKNVWCYEESVDLFGNKSIAGSKTDGAQNTKDVLAKDGYGVFIIAKTANTNSFGGKSDWYLPASHELYALFSNVQTVNRALAVINTEGRKFEDDAAYWSSTAQTGEAVSGNQAYIMDTDLKYDNGDAYGEDGYPIYKTTSCRVCVIRAFN